MISGIIGRAPREEEDAQGSRQEENHIYEAVCECYDDGGKRKVSLIQPLPCWCWAASLDDIYAFWRLVSGAGFWDRHLMGWR